ncbi:MAG: DUF3592 domain-containing protein [Planctomycetota bacterium]
MNAPDDMRCPSVPDPPRQVPRWFFVRRMQAMLFCGVFFVCLNFVLFVALGIFFYFLGGQRLPTADLGLDRQHARADGVILSKQLVSHIHSGCQHPWKVDFRFTTPADRSVTATGYTFDAEMAGASVGDRIVVEYDPNDPSLARPVGGSVSAMPVWAWLVGLGSTGPLMVIGIVLLIIAFVRAETERNVLAYGVGTVAEVLRVRRIGYIHFGAQSPFDVHYRFNDHHGLEVTDRDRTYHYRWAEGLRPGDQVGVVYHPQASTCSTLWLHGGD